MTQTLALANNLIYKKNPLSLPGVPLVGAAGLRTKSPTLSGVIADETPGRGTDRPEIIGRCVKPDGGNDRADLASAISFAGPFTVSWWAKRNDTSDFDFVAGNSVNTSKLGYNTGTHQGFFRVLDGGSADNTTDLGVDTTQWHQVTLTRDANNKVDLYVNGLLRARLFSDAAQSGATTFGRLLNDSSGAQAIGGTVWDLQFFNSALTASEVNQLYSLCEFALPNTPRVAWYNCESQHPTLLLDSSGNNRNATCSGHTATVGNFFYEGNDVPGSYLNKVGGSDIQNLLSGSNFLDNGSYWARNNLGLTPPPVVETTSFGVSLVRVVPDATTAYSSLARAYTYTAGRYCISFYFRAEGYSRASCADGSTGQWSAWFDVSTLTSGMIVGQGSGATSRMEATADSGVYRCIIENILIGAGAKTLQLSTLAPGQVPDGYGNKNAGDGVSGGLIGGVQITETTTATAYAHSYTVARIGNTPRKESDKTKDIFGSPLQYIGEAPRHARLENNNCGTFDGSNDYVDLDSSSTLCQGATPWTFSVRIRPTRSTSDVEYILTKGNTGQWSWALFKQTTNHNCSFAMWNSGGSAVYDVQVPGGFVLNEWQTITVTWSGSVLSLYRNGVSIGSDNTATGTLNTVGTATVRVGARGDLASTEFQGSICDLRFLDGTAISAAEALAVHELRDTVSWTRWLPFSEGKGTDLHNVVPGGAHGSASGIDETTFWGTKQNVFAYNSAKGSSYDAGKYIPARNDSSGLDALGNPLTYAPSPGVWPLSEATLNSNPNNAPRRDWSIGRNLLAGISSSSVLNATRIQGLASPDGRNDAEKVIANVGVASGGAVVIYNGTKPAASARYTGHVYVEQVDPEVTQAIVLLSGLSSGNHVQSRLTFATGEMTTTLAVGAFTNAEAKQPIRLGNGWIIGVSGTTDNSSGISVRAYPAGMTGDGVKGCVVWAPKAEYGNDITPFNGFSDYNPNDPSDFTPNPPELVLNNSFGNAQWATFAASLTLNADGVAAKLIEDSATTVHGVQDVSIPVELGKLYRYSVEAKAGERSAIGILPENPTAGYMFDLSAGTATAVFSASPESTWIENVGSGYYRCNVVVRATSTTTKFRIYLIDGAASNYAGDGSSGLFIRNAELVRYFPVNPNNFHRRRTSGGQLVGIDRVVQYKQPLLGTRLTQAQTFTTEKAL